MKRSIKIPILVFILIVFSITHSFALEIPLTNKDGAFNLILKGSKVKKTILKRIINSEKKTFLKLSFEQCNQEARNILKNTGLFNRVKTIHTTKYFSKENLNSDEKLEPHKNEIKIYLKDVWTLIPIFDFSLSTSNLDNDFKSYIDNSTYSTGIIEGNFFKTGISAVFAEKFTKDSRYSIIQTDAEGSTEVNKTYDLNYKRHEKVKHNFFYSIRSRNPLNWVNSISISGSNNPFYFFKSRIEKSNKEWWRTNLQDHKIYIDHKKIVKGHRLFLGIQLEASLFSEDKEYKNTYIYENKESIFSEAEKDFSSQKKINLTNPGAIDDDIYSANFSFSIGKLNRDKGISEGYRFYGSARYLLSNDENGWATAILGLKKHWNHTLKKIPGFSYFLSNYHLKYSRVIDHASPTTIFFAGRNGTLHGVYSNSIFDTDFISLNSRWGLSSKKFLWAYWQPHFFIDLGKSNSEFLYSFGGGLLITFVPLFNSRLRIQYYSGKLPETRSNWIISTSLDF